MIIRQLTEAGGIQGPRRTGMPAAGYGIQPHDLTRQMKTGDLFAAGRGRHVCLEGTGSDHVYSVEGIADLEKVLIPL